MPSPHLTQNFQQGELHEDVVLSLLDESTQLREQTCVIIETGNTHTTCAMLLTDCCVLRATFCPARCNSDGESMQADNCWSRRHKLIWQHH